MMSAWPGVLLCFGDHPDQRHAQRRFPVTVSPMRHVAWAVQIELATVTSE